MLCTMHFSNSEIKRIVVLSQDTDVLVLFLYHWSALNSHGLEELWIKAGVADTSRYIPLHSLSAKIGPELCRILPAIHSLTGCDFTSKFGTKLASLQANPGLYLQDFGFLNRNKEKQVASAEQYLCNVKKKGTQCKRMDQLRSYLYHHAKSPDLPPTSCDTRLHILRAFYATNLMMNGASNNYESLDPLVYGFELVDGLLMPQSGRNYIPEERTTRCGCVKCAKESCPYRQRDLPCCSFCKCRSIVGSECKNPLG